MGRASTWICLFAALAVVPGPAEAQRYRGGGRVYSPFGLFYDTRSPEWRAAGGNPILYEQLMEQKMMMAQGKALEKEYRRQQQAFQKWLKDQQARKAKKQPTDPAYDQYLLMVEQAKKASVAAPTQPAAKKKVAKKPGTKKAGKTLAEVFDAETGKPTKAPAAASAPKKEKAKAGPAKAQEGGGAAAKTPATDAVP